MSHVRSLGTTKKIFRFMQLNPNNAQFRGDPKDKMVIGRDIHSALGATIR